MTLAQILDLIRHGGSVFVPCLDVENLKKRGELAAIGERINMRAAVGIHGGMVGVMFTRYKDGKPLRFPCDAPE